MSLTDRHRHGLPQLTLHQFTRPLDHFTERRSRLVMDQGYQRGSVWSVERRRNLIKSVLMGLPIGGIILNDRGYTPGGRDTAIIDGKQRIEALWAFVDDEFAVPAWWVGDQFIEPGATFEPVTVDGETVDGIRYSGLNVKFHRQFENRAIPGLEAQDLTYQEEAETFLLINTGGVEQDEETLERARQAARA